jgi:hypothetical protein
VDSFSQALYRALLDDLSFYGYSHGMTVFDNPRLAACHSIDKSLLKKLSVPSNNAADAAALAKFRLVNSHCADWNYAPEFSWEEELLGTFKKCISDFFHPGGVLLNHHPYDILKVGRLGPGASLGSTSGDSYTKLFSSTLTCTSSNLYFWYKRYASRFPEWSNAEIIRQEHFGSARIVSSSRLSFVPKYTNISRTICTEPVLNMFYQLGFGSILLSRLRSFFGIAIEEQPTRNRELARIGSIDESFSTIDLESASDSVSLKLLQWCLPPEIYNLLLRLRCSSTKIGDELVELNMVSSMGNGFTFPLQTVIFSCVVSAVYKYLNIPLNRPFDGSNGNFGVFGDDIVVDSRCYRLTCRLLHLLGFVVNLDKSFSQGPFRESCGFDYFMGVNIRGVYIKNIDTPQSRAAVINQCNLFSTRTGIFLPGLCKLLLSNQEFNYVPCGENDDAGIRVPLSFLNELPKKHKDYQSYLYRRWEPQILLRTRIGDSWIRRSTRRHRAIYNPSGLMIAFLNGWIRSCSIVSRQDTLKYRSKLAVCPNWDMPPAGASSLGASFWQRWNTVVHINLG